MKLHMQRLRSLSQNERTRLVCLQYIRTWLFNFYPDRPDIIRELNQITTELGAKFEEPKLSWKYRWIVTLFGWGAAKGVQLFVRGIKAFLLDCWDNVLFRLERVA
jgi:hypothetical protein